jgi:hypothetical protein
MLTRKIAMTATLPPVVDRVFDADSHETAPLHFWGSLFGSAAGEIAEQVTESMTLQKGNDFYAPDLVADTTVISHDTVCCLKGTSAPGALDFKRRLEVMEQMGVARQYATDYTRGGRRRLQKQDV